MAKACNSRRKVRWRRLSPILWFIRGVSCVEGSNVFPKRAASWNHPSAIPLWRAVSLIAHKSEGSNCPRRRALGCDTHTGNCRRLLFFFFFYLPYFFFRTFFCRFCSILFHQYTVFPSLFPPIYLYQLPTLHKCSLKKWKKKKVLFRYALFSVISLQFLIGLRAIPSFPFSLPFVCCIPTPPLPPHAFFCNLTMTSGPELCLSRVLLFPSFFLHLSFKYSDRCNRLIRQNTGSPLHLMNRPPFRILKCFRLTLNR